MPNYDMKRPCTNCPFRTDEAGIRFFNQDRALEIWMSGYFLGFPCHKAAEYVDSDNDDGRRAGYHMGEDSQHCAGFTVMMLKAHHGWAWPGIGDDQEMADWLASRLDMDAPVFDDLIAYMEANTQARR